MSATIDRQERIGAAAARHRGLAEVFENLGLDYYCEGDLTIEEALRGAALDTPEVMARIEQAAAQPAGTDWDDKPLGEVIGFIEREYHDVARCRLFSIAYRIGDACAKEGSPRLDQLRKNFRVLSEELIAHIEREQLIVFPAIVALEDAWMKGHPAPPVFAGGIRTEASRLVLEHFAIVQRLRNVRAGEPPALAARVEHLTRQIHQFINLENCVVLPRAMALEESVTKEELPCHS